MEKINLVELLKDCPKGMELDCTMIEGLEFDEIVDAYFPIRCRIKKSNGEYNVYNFTEYGCWTTDDFAKCVIFPKGKTTWEGFLPPCRFKDGDIVSATMYPEGTWIGIFKQYGVNTFESHCSLNTSGEFRNVGLKNHSLKGIHLATVEEKQKLFDAIKANGYNWNAETKTLEKLVEPKFKVGDTIKNKNSGICDKVIKIFKDCYLVEGCSDRLATIGFDIQDNWELVPNKFDITTLKPFDKVLVRDNEAYH